MGGIMKKYLVVLLLMQIVFSAVASVEKTFDQRLLEKIKIVYGVGNTKAAQYLRMYRLNLFDSLYALPEKLVNELDQKKKDPGINFVIEDLEQDLKLEIEKEKSVKTQDESAQIRKEIAALKAQLNDVLSPKVAEKRKNREFEEQEAKRPHLEALLPGVIFKTTTGNVLPTVIFNTRAIDL